MSTKQQAMAKRILESINADETVRLNMNTWIYTPNPYGVVDPDLVSQDTETPCGTTMCVAGWGAFLDGWKLNPNTSEAIKDGETEAISTIGRRALDLEDDALFYTDNQSALACLRRMAEGETYNVDMLLQEEEKRWPDDEDDEES